MSKTGGKRTQRDDDEEEIALVESLNQLTVDRHFQCPHWLQDYSQFAACAEELKELMRMTLVNFQLHNYMTAIKDAFRTSGLEKYFEQDSHESVIDRDTFKRVFDDRIAPYKTNSYRVTCPDDPDLDVVIKKTMRHIERVCFLLSVESLFVFLAVLAKLRLEPFTNPIAVSIHKALGAMTYEEKCAALDHSPSSANQWQRQDFESVRREIYWTYKACVSQNKEWEQWQRDVDTLFDVMPFEPAPNQLAPFAPVVHMPGRASERGNDDDDDDNNRIQEDDNVLSRIAFNPSRPAWIPDHNTREPHGFSRPIDVDSDDDLDDK